MKPLCRLWKHLVVWRSGQPPRSAGHDYRGSGYQPECNPGDQQNPRVRTDAGSQVRKPGKPRILSPSTPTLDAESATRFMMAQELPEVSNTKQHKATRWQQQKSFVWGMCSYPPPRYRYFRII